MNRRELACAIAEANAADEELRIRLIGASDGVAVLLREMEEVAFRVHAECQDESEEAAIGWSKDRKTWCVVCLEPAAFTAAACRIAEELHLYDGLDSPLAADAGITVIDRRNDRDATLAAIACPKR